MRDYGRDIRAFVQEAIPGDEPVVIMGFSLGALILEDDIAWARQHAQDVEIVPLPGAGHEIRIDIVMDRSERFLTSLH